MRHFRNNTIFLILFLSLFFNIDRISTSLTTSIYIEQFVYFHGVAIIISICLFPLLHKIHIIKLLILNLIFLVVEKLVIPGSHPLFGGAYIYLTITEATGLSILLYLAYQQSHSIFHFEQAVGKLSFGNHSLHPILSLEDSMHDIQAQMHFSRLHTTPLSVIVIEPEPESLHHLIHHAFQEAYRVLRTHCSLTKVATLIQPALRRTDLVIENRQDGRLLIVCPGTDPEEIRTLTSRLQMTANQHEMTIRLGCASFPDEAYTFDDLVFQAESQLHPEPSADRPASAPTHITSDVLKDVETYVE